MPALLYSASSGGPLYSQVLLYRVLRRSPFTSAALWQPQYSQVDDQLLEPHHDDQSEGVHVIMEGEHHDDQSEEVHIIMEGEHLDDQSEGVHIIMEGEHHDDQSECSMTV